MLSAAARTLLTSRTTLRGARVYSTRTTRLSHSATAKSARPNGFSEIRTMTSASAVPHRIGDTFRVKGLKLTDHFFDVPLDHGFRAPGAGDVPPTTESSIEIFAREVRAGDKNDEAVASMPWLVFLQGGPGFECARLTESGGWIAHAVQSHRVLLLDQRGTGRSSRVSTAGLDRRFGADDVESKAKYLANFRADSIVADAELVRKTLLGDDSKWALLGQSFGGFCILRYLSVASGGVSEAFLTGGLPPLVHCADAATPAYRALIKRVRAQNAKFYRRFPMDVTRVRDVVKFVRDQPGGSVSTSSGGKLTVRGVQALGFGMLGTAGGMENLHYLFEKAWDDDSRAHLSYAFLKSCEDVHAFDTNPLYACLHESIYCNGGGASDWAAERVFSDDEFSKEFSAENALGPASDPHTPVLFTGEMVFPFMFDDIAALTPMKAVADALAKKDDWPRLYDVDALRACEVPVACASYVEDMFVDFDLAAETASRIGKYGARVWSTSEYMHSGIREDGGRILKKLMEMARDEEPLR